MVGSRAGEAQRREGRWRFFARRGADAPRSLRVKMSEIRFTLSSSWAGLRNPGSDGKRGCEADKASRRKRSERSGNSGGRREKGSVGDGRGRRRRA